MVFPTNPPKDTPTKSHNISVMLSLFGYSITDHYSYSNDDVRTIWGFYNTKTGTYSAPINSSKCGDSVDISDTRDYTAMQLNLTRLNMSYTPEVDDYVKWRNVEGWVYFVDKEYLTIEVGVKNKEDDLVPMHKKHHILIVCHHWDWHELEYIKNRRGNIDTYKSQIGRYSDPQ